MKVSTILGVLAVALMLNACDKTQPPEAAAVQPDVAARSLQPARNAVRQVAGATRFGGAPSAEIPAPGTPVPSTIDPPSPAISMSAGVTETVDPPRAGPPLAQAVGRSPDGAPWAAAEQSTPVVHYPPEPAADESN
ncbi:hypothetical protein PXJ20_12850 [Paraburkholderia sp. A1RI_3L]|uniref:hypothetical protein n=1 Tax=Paraburkholderia TaxID=1822464 RepID=UPI003B7C6529